MALIDQEQAAKQIRGNKEWYADCQWLKGYNKACEDNAQIVEQMKGQEITVCKWIPVSERLPEKDGIYLVSGGGKVWSAQYLTVGCLCGWSNDARNPIISAWMRLPESYKIGGKE